MPFFDVLVVGCAPCLLVMLLLRRWIAASASQAWRERITRSRAFVAAAPAAWIAFVLCAAPVHLLEVGAWPERPVTMLANFAFAPPPPPAPFANCFRAVAMLALLPVILAPLLWIGLSIERGFLSRFTTRLQLSALLIGWCGVVILLRSQTLGVVRWVLD